MVTQPKTDIFKPTPSKLESRADAATRAAREIADHEAKARTAKMERLRAARLAQEAAAPPPAPTVRRVKAAAPKAVGGKSAASKLAAAK